MQTLVIGVSDKMSVQEVLEATCNKRQLNPNDHFVRLKLSGNDNFKIPEKSAFMENEVSYSLNLNYLLHLVIKRT